METSIIQNTIDAKYHLRRQNKDWLLENNVKVRSVNHNSFGFSLDKDDKSLSPFRFFSGKPPEHVAKMCDAIIAQRYGDTLYVVVIEQKSSSKDRYRKQLINGRLFCEWLMGLYQAHGYSDRDPIYVGLLIWQPRPIHDKGETTHRPLEFRQFAPFCSLVEIRNQTLVQLHEILKAVRNKALQGQKAASGREL